MTQPEQFNYEKTLEMARAAAIPLKVRLEALVLGKTLAGWSCNCGTISSGEAQAVRVVPAGNEFEYQIVHSYLWTVEMQETGSKDKGYGTGLSPFLPMEDIDKMFKEAFEGINTKELETEYFARKRRSET